MAAGDETLKDRGPKLLEEIVHTCIAKLAAKPPTPTVIALREEAHLCQRELDTWRTNRPSPETRGAMRARILEIHRRLNAL